MLTVSTATYAGDYKIDLAFNNGKKGVVDLKETIFKDHRPIFSALQNEAEFRNFMLEQSTIVWPNELDLACEYLFFLTFKDDPDLTDQFRKWGYIH